MNQNNLYENSIEDIPTNPYLDIVFNLEKIIYLISNKYSIGLIVDEAKRILHLLIEYNGLDFTGLLEQVDDALKDTVIFATTDPECLTSENVGWLKYLQKRSILESEYYLHPDLPSSEGHTLH